MKHKDIIALKSHLSARNEIMRDTMLVLEKKESETWLECAKRHAAPYGLEQDITNAYNDYLDQNFSESDAALHACYEWDILPVRNSTEDLLNQLKLFLRRVIVVSV